MTAEEMEKKIKELERKRDLGSATNCELVELQGLYEDLSDYLDNTLPRVKRKEVIWER